MDGWCRWKPFWDPWQHSQMCWYVGDVCELSSCAWEYLVDVYLCERVHTVQCIFIRRRCRSHGTANNATRQINKTLLEENRRPRPQTWEMYVIMQDAHHRHSTAHSVAIDPCQISSLLVCGYIYIYAHMQSNGYNYLFIREERTKLSCAYRIFFHFNNNQVDASMHSEINLFQIFSMISISHSKHTKYDRMRRWVLI